MTTKKDKNGYKLETGTPVRLTQTMADYQSPSRIYHIEEINGELFLTIPLSEFSNDGENFQVESVR